MGMDLRANPVTAAKMDFDALLRRCARWDFSVSSNPLSSEVWAKVYPVEYENLEVGYPRNDVLATATEEAVAAARASLGLEPGQRAVLYAPTHRDWETGYVPVLDLGAAAAALGPDGVLLARAHYFYDADPVARVARPRGAAARRRRASLDRDPVPGGRRPGDRLFHRSCSTTPCSTARS